MATATANISHLPHTAHPIPLREQAFTLHCQGLRSPAISAELGVPERTIRSWIAAALDDLKDDLRLSRKEQLLLAVERQHQLTATAWQQFNHEAAARDALLDAALQALLHATDPTASANPSARPLHLHLPASTPAPRYLSLIIQANKEINRLLGLHTLAKLHLLTPDPLDTEPAPCADRDIPAKTATTTATESATAFSPLADDDGGAFTRMPSAADSDITGRIGNRHHRSPKPGKNGNRLRLSVFLRFLRVEPRSSCGKNGNGKLIVVAVENGLSRLSVQ